MDEDLVIDVSLNQYLKGRFALNIFPRRLHIYTNVSVIILFEL